MGTSASRPVAANIRERRRAVETRLASVGAGPSLRPVPPEGQLGSDDYAMPRLAAALAELGPVFASFGRYLATRVDLVSRRDALALSVIPDRAAPMSEADVLATVERELGTPVDRRFFAFEPRPRVSTIWTQRHDAWVAPGVPVLVTVVRPDANAALAADLPLLPLIASCAGIAPAVLNLAIDDFALTLRRRLDQTHQAAALATLAADASMHGGFAAPVAFRDHTAAAILTVERPVGATLRDLIGDAAVVSPSFPADLDVGRRLLSAWLRHAVSGRLVPFDFDHADVIVAGDQIMMIGGAFEPHPASERARFLSYLNAVAADDPDAAAAWIVDARASEGGEEREEELRRRLRQAVPFRDGESSGDDQLIEQVLVQWRMAARAGWLLTPHHLHLYRGLYAASALAQSGAPQDDVLAAALLDERVHIGIAEARAMVDPRNVGATLDRLLQDMVHLPQKLDDVLTLAAEGRLRVRLNVPDGDDARRTRNRTVLLVAVLVALTATATMARHAAPALGPGAERVAAVVVLLLGGWLLVAAARVS
jgi:predicted unusual protein kinase regulating ubiquinone biosynthesis (AarF/ABC1/UbiB family)